SYPAYYYPPQPGRYPPPPPGYYYPPPQGVYAQPPPVQHRKRRFLAMPYAGIHSYQSQDASNYDPGARVGALIGGRIGDIASLNGELSVNISNLHGIPSGTSYSQTNVIFAFSPLFQIPAGSVEVVLGPKAGIFVMETSVSSSGVSVSENVEGWILG